MAFEGTPHVLVTRDRAEREWGPREKEWFQGYAWPLTDEVWVTWSPDPEEWRPLNHSCDPNVWLEGLDLVARRTIAPGEEIRVDYATYGNNILAPFDCHCGAASCRGRVREDDHLGPALDRYGRHVSDFVKQKREALLAKGPSRGRERGS
jgi:D-alanine-D-alanine ligase